MSNKQVSQECIDVLAGCGTFMGGLVQLMRAKGYAVNAYDKAAFSPMKEQLEQAGVDIKCGYEHYKPNNARLVVVGNSISRRTSVMTQVMNHGVHYTSGPAWLAEQVLKEKEVIAIAGTHGKTTTTALVSWILETAGRAPGYLIGGSPGNFNQSARLGEGRQFVIEADEYDSAFWDKRPKFMHYRPQYAILNNLEFDHADIYPDLAAIIKQFRLFLYTIPSNGLVVFNGKNKLLKELVPDSCDVPAIIFNDPKHWHVELLDAVGSQLCIKLGKEEKLLVNWKLLGRANAENLTAAVALCVNMGIDLADIKKAAESFQGVDRRMVCHDNGASGPKIYEDFAHHPTALKNTIDIGQNLVAPGGKLHLIVSLDTFTMCSGEHAEFLQALCLRSDIEVCLVGFKALHWLDQHNLAGRYAYTPEDVQASIAETMGGAKPGDVVLVTGTRNLMPILQAVK